MLKSFCVALMMLTIESSSAKLRNLLGTEEADDYVYEAIKTPSGRYLNHIGGGRVISSDDPSAEWRTNDEGQIINQFSGHYLYASQRDATDYLEDQGFDLEAIGSTIHLFLLCEFHGSKDTVKRADDGRLYVVDEREDREITFTNFAILNESMMFALESEEAWQRLADMGADQLGRLLRKFMRQTRQQQQQ